MKHFELKFSIVVQHFVQLTIMVNLDSSDCGKKLEQSEETMQAQGGRANPTQYSPLLGLEPAPL